MEPESNLKLLRDYGITVVLAVAVALLVRSFFLEAYRIPTVAMRPTLEPGDTIFVGKWPIPQFKRGDLILFSVEDPDNRDYIKRVVGLPGDRIQIKKGVISLNGQEIRQELAFTGGGCGIERLDDIHPHELCLEPPAPDDFAETRVPPGDVFVLGDLRTRTQLDPANLGKTWGLIPQGWVKGRVLWIWLSIDVGASAGASGSTGLFPKFRFNRMFRRVE